MSDELQLPPAWRPALGQELEKPYFRQLAHFLRAERAAGEVFPPPGEVFTALALTPYDRVKVALLGQDPYHDVGQAHGLAFSVRPGVPAPPSLQNMLKELRDDLGHPLPCHGNLEGWARQGVLLLNAVLTVRAHAAASHKGKGWETFTDAVIRALSARERPLVFVLWGAYAKKKKALVDTSRHIVLEGVHPSPLSAHKGFFGSRPFSAINAALKQLGEAPVDWRLSESASGAGNAP